MTTLLGAALRIKQMLTPGTPPAGTSSLYPKADGKWYTKDPTGAEALVGPDTQVLAPVRNSVRDLQGNVVTSGLQTLDGVLGVAGDRVLLRQQTAVAENGIWIVAAGAWTRATDADTAAKVPKGTRVRVLEGNDHKYKTFTQIESAPGGANGQVWDVVVNIDTGGMFTYPVPNGTGHLFYDGNQHAIAVWNGSAWEFTSQSIFCTSTTRPGPFNQDGLVIYETDTGLSYIYQGSSWKAIGGAGGSAEVNVSTAGPSPRVGQLLWVDTDEPAGLPSLEAPTVLNLRKDVVQAVSAATWTTITGWAVQDSYPQWAAESAGAFTVPSNGYYKMSVEVQYSATTGGRTAGIDINGVTVGNALVPADAGFSTTCTFWWEGNLRAGDVVKFLIYAAAAGNVVAATGGNGVTRAVIRKVYSGGIPASGGSPDTAWIVPTFQNSWSNWGAPWETVAYRRIAGVTYLRGLARAGTIDASTPIFTLPVGFRPNSDTHIATHGTAKYGALNVFADGRVTVNTGVDAGMYVSLRISFPADQ